VNVNIVAVGGNIPGRVTASLGCCLLVYTSATSRLSLSVPSSRLSLSPVSLESRLTLSTSSRHIGFIYHFLTHPPITRTIGREESMEMGFIRPHPHRLFALESGRRSSSRPAFTPTYTTVVYLCTHVARGQYTRNLWLKTGRCPHRR
jgi:hypothetical protein